MRRGWRWVAALAASVLLTGAACGLTEDDQLTTLAERDIPAELLEQSSSTTDSLPPGEGVVVPVYVAQQIGDEVRLSPLERRVADPVDVEQRIRVLLSEPPTATEQVQGLASRIPAKTELLAVEVSSDRSLVRIDLSTDLSNVQGQALRVAFAQLVWTATEVPGLAQASVRFDLEGEPTPAIDGQGNEKEAVDRSDYRTLRPSR